LRGIDAPSNHLVCFRNPSPPQGCPAHVRKQSALYDENPPGQAYDRAVSSSSAVTEADILAEIIAPDKPGLDPEAARAILRLQFNKHAGERIRQLLDANNRGNISDGAHLKPVSLPRFVVIRSGQPGSRFISRTRELWRPPRRLRRTRARGRRSKLSPRSMVRWMSRNSRLIERGSEEAGSV